MVLTISQMFFTYVELYESMSKYSLNGMAYHRWDFDSSKTVFTLSNEFMDYIKVQFPSVTQSERTDLGAEFYTQLEQLRNNHAGVLASGNGNIIFNNNFDGWFYQQPKEQNTAVCECGTTKTLGPKSDSSMFHSSWCPIKVKYEEEKKTKT